MRALTSYSKNFKALIFNNNFKKTILNPIKSQARFRIAFTLKFMTKIKTKLIILKEIFSI